MNLEYIPSYFGSSCLNLIVVTHITSALRLNSFICEHGKILLFPLAQEREKGKKVQKLWYQNVYLTSCFQ